MGSVGTGRDRRVGPPHHAIAVANFDLPRDILIDVDRAARGREAALSLELQQSIVVPDDPVIRHDARVLEPEHLIQSHPARHGDVASSCASCSSRMYALPQRPWNAVQR
jgi:hypothetical protein